MQPQSVIETRSSVNLDECHQERQEKSNGTSLKRTLSVVRLSKKQPLYKSDSAMKALKMSVIHVVTFIAFWTPYSVMATWLVLSNSKLFKKLIILNLNRENIDYESAKMVNIFSNMRLFYIMIIAEALSYNWSCF